jgi:hypothetical protein
MCAGQGKYFSLTKPEKHPELDAYFTLNWHQICWYAENPLNVDKDAAWWVIPSTLNTRLARKKDEQLRAGEYWMLAADIDKGNLELATVCDGVRRVIDPGTEFLVYATKRSTHDDKRWRALVPTANAIPTEHFHHSAGVFNEALSVALSIEVDRVTERMQQYLYVANEGVHYAKHREAGVPWGAGPDQRLMYSLTKKAIEWSNADPVRTRETKRAKERGKYLKWFAQTYPIDVLFEHYGFVSDSKGTHWHHPEWQTTGSYGTEIKDNGDRWVTASQSVAARLGRNGGDAFDLYVAMEAGGDFDMAYAALVTKTPTEVRQTQGFYCNGEYVELKRT